MSDDTREDLEETGSPEMKHVKEIRHPVHLYFSYDPVRSQSKCLVSPCTKIIPGKHSGNLEKHIQRWHKDKLESLLREKSQYELLRTRKKVEKQPMLHNVRLSPAQLKNALVRLIAIHGRPFSLMNDTAFQDIVRPLTEAMSPSLRFAVNDELVRNLIPQYAKEMRHQISKELKGKLLSLKIDSTTKDGKPFFGVNVQFSSAGAIQLRTLAVHQVSFSQTGSNLRYEIEEILQSYGISIEQVYTLTSDNGSNMFKAAEFLGDDQEERINNEMDEVEQENQWDVDIELSTDSFRVVCVKCCAHTLQLCVESAIKLTQNMKETIQKWREVSKFLRLPTIRLQLKKKGLPVPIIDNDTRWDPMLLMLKSIRELRDFCDSYPNDIIMCEDDWIKLDTTIDAMEPAWMATKKFQAEQLTLGDMFGAWLECKMRTQKIDSELARNIVQNMNTREKSQYAKSGKQKVPSLFQYPAFTSALLVDPRYFSVLSASEIEEAKGHLNALWIRLCALRSGKKEHSFEDEIRIYNTDAEDEDSDMDDEVSTYLKQKDVVRKSEMAPQNGPSILLQLENYFRNTQRLPRKENVFTFWERNRLLYPDVYEVAMVVLAVPATQVSVERLFSSLTFILSPLRNRLSSEMVEDILTIRNNVSFFEKSNIITNVFHSGLDSVVSASVSSNVSVISSTPSDCSGLSPDGPCT